MLLAQLVATSTQVRRTNARTEKLALLAERLRRCSPDELSLAVAYLSGRLPQGKLGIGYRIIADASAPPSDEPSLTLGEVDRRLTSIRHDSGAGSSVRRRDALGMLFRKCTRVEAEFLRGLLLDGHRQGASELMVAAALAQTFAINPDDMRRAHMLSGDLVAVAQAIAASGPPAVYDFTLRLFRPVEPMLAKTANTVSQAAEHLDDAIFEYKLDGARIQVHKSANDVAIYTRQRNEVTWALPEVVERVAALPTKELILDGEALALGAEGEPLAFQETIKRFGRKRDIPALRTALPISEFYFDCLLQDGQPLIDQTTAERNLAMERVIPTRLRMPRLSQGGAAAGEKLLAAALDEGHEGIMVKDPEARYLAGHRGNAWFKVKQVHTADLVVVAVDWGSGRRKGWLSNLHLAARTDDGFAEVGKTFKGMTDEILRWQTGALGAIAVDEHAGTVRVRPEFVVEVAFNNVQRSPNYASGIALRFARLKRYRPDKMVAQADTLASLKTRLPDQ